jgi:hypothetical protein
MRSLGLARWAGRCPDNVVMQRLRSTLSALGLVLSVSAQAVGVTQQMLDLERNPVDALALAR